MQNTELPPYDTFYRKICSCDPLNAEITEHAAVKLKLSKPPPTGIDKIQHLPQIWKQEQMSSFKDFLLFALVKQKRRCANFGINAKVD